MFPFMSAAPQIAQAYAFATWNPNDKAPSIVLSNDNRSAKNTNTSSVYPSVRGTKSKSVGTGGKFQLEFTLNPLTGDTGVGIGRAAMTLGSYVGSEANGRAYYSSGTMYDGSGTTQGVASYTSADKIGVVLDCDAGTVTFYKNGVAQGSPYAASGIWFPAATINTTADQIDINVGQKVFAYPIAGAVAWDVDPNAVTFAYYSATDRTNGTSVSASRRVAVSSGANQVVRGDKYISSGKRYMEFICTVYDSGANGGVGIANANASVLTAGLGNDANGYDYNISSGQVFGGSWTGTTKTGAIIGVGSVVGVAIDFSAGTVGWYINNVLQQTTSGIPAGSLTPAIGTYTAPNLGFNLNTGQEPFFYTPPSGYVAWS